MQPAWKRWFRVERARRTAGDVTAGEACALSALGLTETEWAALGEETRRVMVARWVSGHELGSDPDRVAQEVARVPEGELLAYLGTKAECGGAAPAGGATPPELTDGPPSTTEDTPRRADTGTGGPTAAERCALAALGASEAEWSALGEAAQRERVTRWRHEREPDITLERMGVEVAAVPRAGLLEYVAAKGGGCAPADDGRPLGPVEDAARAGVLEDVLPLAAAGALLAWALSD